MSYYVHVCMGAMINNNALCAICNMRSIRSDTLSTDMTTQPQVTMRLCLCAFETFKKKSSSGIQVVNVIIMDIKKLHKRETCLQNSAVEAMRCNKLNKRVMCILQVFTEGMQKRKYLEWK